MKNKKLIYVLLPAAVLIWGIILVKIIIRIKRPEKNILLNQTVGQPATDAIRKDSITLIANYRDPFLGDGNTQVKSSRKVVEPKDRAFKLRKESVQNIKWPEILYYGTITTKRDDQHTGLVRLGDNDFLIHKSDFIEDILFVEIFPDSIKVKYQGELKTIIIKH